MLALSLLPVPKVVKIGRGGGHFVLPEKMWILMDERKEVRDVFAVEDFIAGAAALCETEFGLALGSVSVDSRREVWVRYDEGVAKGHSQGYRLVISKSGVELSAFTQAGVFYGMQTLLQVIREVASERRKGKGLVLPFVEIEDWPDFERRGFYHDCARGKIPTVQTLLQMIEDIGHLKYNEFQLYVENGFEFRMYPEMYDDTTPFTAEEMVVLDEACRARHIDFVPSLTSLGHFEKILSRPAFRHLAEVEPEELKKAGVKTWSEQPWTLCVTDPEARTFLKGMYLEFVPNFSSGQFNICCDESWDLGKGRSKKLLEKIGAGQMYVDWVNYCNGLAKGLGKRIQMWGDIILNHPELIAQLPADATLLEWGYESHHKFDEHLKIFAERVKGGGGQRFYAAPGTTSWLSLAGRSRNAFGNIYNACAAGLKHGAAGVLVTDWGDNGHQQLLAVSMLPLAYGAAAAWNLDGVENPAIAETPNWDTGIVPAGAKSSDEEQRPFLDAVSLHVFGEESGELAWDIYQLGLTYERFSWQRFNGSLEWFLFREKWDFPNYVNRAKPRDLPKVIAACEKLKGKFEKAMEDSENRSLTKLELILTCEQIIHTCKRTALRQAWFAAHPEKFNPEEKELFNQKPRGLPTDFAKRMKRLGAEAKALEEKYATLWLARNKPSRLADVLAEFQRLATEYKNFVS